MTFLLDTHTIVWAGRGDHRLGADTKAILQEKSSILLVSAASAWEVATKVRIGKFPEAEELEADFIPILRKAGFRLLPVSVEDALRAGRLVSDHRDPWDRMIAAQALALDIPVLSNDIKLDTFGVRRIW